MKGIILAAGKGTRLYPMTRPICKPLLPVFDKPMIYYPLTVLIQAGIDDILIIVPPEQTDMFFSLLGDGSDLGIKITYAEQLVPRGIADAFIVGEDFISGDNVCLVLGDNIFYSETLDDTLKKAIKDNEFATIFGYQVEDPRPFGVVEFDENGRVLSIEEKPANPKSNYIVPGIYIYDCDAVKAAKSIKPSKRGELEITDVNNWYLQNKSVNVSLLDDNFIWLDAGTADSLVESAITVQKLQKNTGNLVGSPENAAYMSGFINKYQLEALGKEMASTVYGKMILQEACK